MIPIMKKVAAILFDALYERSVVRDNRLRSTCDRQYVIEQGVPTICHDLLIYHCRSMGEVLNRWIAGVRKTADSQ